MPTEYARTGRVIITGIKDEVHTEMIEEVLKKAEIVYDKVFIEVERVHTIYYDCITGLLAAA